jgi:nucleoside-diphosphate-sugar epimerase
MVIPAVRGTETALESALKAGSQLTSVVVTASVVSITNPKEDPEYTFTELDWASSALDRAIKDKEEGSKTPSNILYAASKTAADRAVWKFQNVHRVSKFFSSLIFKKVAF